MAYDQSAPPAHMTGPSPGGMHRARGVVEQGHPVIFDRIVVDGGVAPAQFLAQYDY